MGGVRGWGEMGGWGVESGSGCGVGMGKHCLGSSAGVISRRQVFLKNLVFAKKTQVVLEDVFWFAKTLGFCKITLFFLSRL